jgi:hypothetical protein
VPGGDPTSEAVNASWRWKAGGRADAVQRVKGEWVFAKASIVLGQFDMHILMIGGRLFPRWTFSTTQHQDVKSANEHVSTVQQGSSVKQHLKRLWDRMSRADDTERTPCVQHCMESKVREGGVKQNTVLQDFQYLKFALCHSHQLYSCCPRLYTLVQEDARTPSVQGLPLLSASHVLFATAYTAVRVDARTPSKSIGS